LNKIETFLIDALDLKTVLSSYLLLRTEERSSPVYRTIVGYQIQSLFYLNRLRRHVIALFNFCYFLGGRHLAWHAGAFAIYLYF
jgi:hypothetical protein